MVSLVVLLCHVVSCVMSHRVMWCHIMSCHVMLSVAFPLPPTCESKTKSLKCVGWSIAKLRSLVIGSDPSIGITSYTMTFIRRGALSQYNLVDVSKKIITAPQIYPNYAIDYAVFFYGFTIDMSTHFIPSCTTGANISELLCWFPVLCCETKPVFLCVVEIIKLVTDEWYWCCVCRVQHIKRELSCRRPAYCSVRRSGCQLRQRCGKTGQVALSERQTLTDMLSTLSQRWNSVLRLINRTYSMRYFRFIYSSLSMSSCDHSWSVAHCHVFVRTMITVTLRRSAAMSRFLEIWKPWISREFCNFRKRGKKSVKFESWDFHVVGEHW